MLLVLPFARKRVRTARTQVCSFSLGGSISAGWNSTAESGNCVNPRLTGALQRGSLRERVGGLRRLWRERAPAQGSRACRGDWSK